MRTNDKLIARLLALLTAGGIVGVFSHASAAAEVSVRFADGVAVIKTDRYEVAWQNGSMVGLRTFLPREQKITVDACPMQAAELPTGLAVVAQRKSELLKTYGVVAAFPLAATYPAYHPPVPGQTDVAWDPIDNGVRLTYRGLAGEAQGVLIQELVVEAGTGDLGHPPAGQQFAARRDRHRLRLAQSPPRHDARCALFRRRALGCRLLAECGRQLVLAVYVERRPGYRGTGCRRLFCRLGRGSGLAAEVFSPPQHARGAWFGLRIVRRGSVRRPASDRPRLAVQQVGWEKR